ncbi:MAG: cytochrome B6 [Cyanobacteria bacterium J06638_7]
MDPGLQSPARLLGLSTAGEAAAGLPFGLDIATLQNWVLLYLGLSSLAFVVVWVLGYLRSR